jgi:hypothetical protein
MSSRQGVENYHLKARNLVGFTTGARVFRNCATFSSPGVALVESARRPRSLQSCRWLGIAWPAGSPTDDVDESVISEGKDCRWRIA